MTRRMQQAIDRLKALPEIEQDNVADFVLNALAEDERWARTTYENADKLRGLIDRIREDDRAGKCEPLDPERL